MTYGETDTASHHQDTKSTKDGEIQGNGMT